MGQCLRDHLEISPTIDVFEKDGIKELAAEVRGKLERVRDAI